MLAPASYSVRSCCVCSAVSPGMGRLIQRLDNHTAAGLAAAGVVHLHLHLHLHLHQRLQPKLNGS